MNQNQNQNQKPNSFNVVAIDDGYGDVKFDNGVLNLVPSFVTMFVPKPKEDFSNSDSGPDSSKSMGRGKSKLQYIASEIDNQKYVVGDYAVKLDTNIRWSARENKHTDPMFPVLFKTVLGLMTTRPHEEIDLLMMNLPIKYDTPKRRNILANLAIGTHEVNLSFDGVNFQRRAITVNDIMIKKQPFGSLCDVILNGDGNIINTDIAKGFNVIVDIGSRTLNILTVDALEEQPQLTMQTNDGMYSAYIQVGKYLESELGVTIPDGKLSSLMTTKEIKRRDISPLIHSVYEAHAVKIINILETLLLNSWGFVNNVLFTGGGSEVLKSYLQGSINTTTTNVLFLDRFSNARGLKKYGMRQSKKMNKNFNSNFNSTMPASAKIGSKVYPL